MIQEDYLVKLFAQLIQGVRAALNRAQGKEDPLDSALMLENMVGQACNFDPKLLLSLSPESMTNLMTTSGFDPELAEFVARSLLTEASYLRQLDNSELADLREAQAQKVLSVFAQHLDYETITNGEQATELERYLDYLETEKVQVSGQIHKN